ncbi:MAG TPA: hypothetical protein VG013_27285 [Gemmataceae bacterium]|nr:hypothetical protein [Gemmataceae bacterium]
MSGTQTSSDVSAQPLPRARLRRLSGKVAAAWLVICLLLTAVLIPMALRLPPWIESEIVLGVWWVVWFVVLTTFLYSGLRVTDDHALQQPRNWFSSWFSSNQRKSEKQTEPRGSWWDGFFWGWFLGDELVYLIIAAVVLVGGIWLLFEVAIPVILFLLYFVARGMLAGVANDRHHCRGNLGRAVVWGFVWATVYTGPLAGAVWFVHFVHQRAQAGA